MGTPRAQRSKHRRKVDRQKQKARKRRRRQADVMYASSPIVDAYNAVLDGRGPKSDPMDAAAVTVMHIAWDSGAAEQAGLRERHPMYFGHRPEAQATVCRAVLPIHGHARTWQIDPARTNWCIDCLATLADWTVAAAEATQRKRAEGDDV